MRKEEQLLVGSPPLGEQSTLGEQPPPAVELGRKEGEGKDGASGLGLPGYSLSLVMLAGLYPKSTRQVSNRYQICFKSFISGYSQDTYPPHIGYAFEPLLLS